MKSLGGSVAGEMRRHWDGKHCCRKMDGEVFVWKEGEAREGEDAEAWGGGCGGLPYRCLGLVTSETTGTMEGQHPLSNIYIATSKNRHVLVRFYPDGSHD